MEFVPEVTIALLAHLYLMHAQ